MYTPRILDQDRLYGAFAVPNIHYVNSVPGAGKTHAALLMAVETLRNAEHANYLLVYVAPTMRLLNQFQANLRKMVRKSAMSRVHMVNSNDPTSSVVQKFRGHLVGYDDADEIVERASNGSVILITHECLRRVPLDMPGKDRVSLIFDEARQCMQESMKLKAPMDVVAYLMETCVVIHERLPSAITTARWSWAPNARFDEQMLRSAWKKAHPNVQTRDIEKFMKFVEELRNGSQHVWVALDTDERDMQDFQVNVTLSPSRLFANYGKVLIMSAFFEYSQMYHMLARQECDVTTRKGRSMLGQLEQADRVHLVNVTDDLIDKQRVERIMEKRLTNATLTYVLKNESLSKFHLNTGIIVNERDPKSIGEASKAYTTAYADEPKAKKRAPSFKQFWSRILQEREGQTKIPKTARARKDIVESLKPSKYSVIQYLCGKSVALQKAWLAQSSLKPEPLLLCINSRGYRSDNSPLWQKENLQKLLNGKQQNVIEVPVINQGLNEWLSYTTASFMATVKLSTEQIKFLRDLLPDYHPDLDRTVDQCIQFIFRSAIRDANSDKKCLLIVSDKKLAGLVNQTLGNHMQVVSPKSLLPNWEAKSVACVQQVIDPEVKRELFRRYRQTATYKVYRSEYDKKRMETDEGKQYRALTSKIIRREARLKKDQGNRVLLDEIAALRIQRADIKRSS